MHVPQDPGARGPAELFQLDDPALFPRLEHLAAVARKCMTGEIGTLRARRATTRGGGTHLAGQRRYSYGDDPRFVDWAAYARLDEIFVRTFEPEDAAPLSCIVDVSASMRVGAMHKYRQACLLAAAGGAVGALALAGAVMVRAPSTSEAVFEGKAGLPLLLKYLQNDPPGSGEASHLAGAVRRVTTRTRRGPIIIITDAVPLHDLDLALRSRGNRPAVVFHVVERSEIHPLWRGIVQLTDPETGRTRTMVMTRSLRQRYEEFMQRRLVEIEHSVRHAGAAYVRAWTDVPFDALMMEMLRSGAGI